MAVSGNPRGPFAGATPQTETDQNHEGIRRRGAIRHSWPSGFITSVTGTLCFSISGSGWRPYSAIRNCLTVTLKRSSRRHILDGLQQWNKGVTPCDVVVPYTQRDGG